MATLIVPTVAYQFKKRQKWHLAKEHGDYAGELTVCKYIITTKEDSLFPVTPSKPISEIPAKDLCQKCLGALKVED